MGDFSQGSSVTAAGFNDLFARLNDVRALHEARADVSGLSTAFDLPARAGDIVYGGTRSLVNDLVADIQKLADNIGNMSATFATSIKIPSVGDLLQASRANTDIEEYVSRVEAVCVDCTHFSAHFRSHFRSHFGSNNGNFSHFTNNGFNNSRCNRFGNFSNCPANTSATFRSFCSNHTCSNFSGR